MSAALRLFPAPHTNRPRPVPGRLRGALVASAALSAGASLLLAGCSGGSSGTSTSAGSMHAAVAALGADSGAAAGLPGSPVKQAQLTALPPAGQAIVYTASLTVRAADVRAAAARAEATRLVTSATVWVTSCARCDSETLVPSRADSAASVAW